MALTDVEKAYALAVVKIVESTLKIFFNLAITREGLEQDSLIGTSQAKIATLTNSLQLKYFKSIDTLLRSIGLELCKCSLECDGRAIWHINKSSTEPPKYSNREEVVRICNNFTVECFKLFEVKYTQPSNFSGN